MIMTAKEMRAVSIDALLANPQVSRTLSTIQSVIDRAAKVAKRITSYRIDEVRTGLTWDEREGIVKYLEDQGYKIDSERYTDAHEITISW